MNIFIICYFFLFVRPPPRSTLSLHDALPILPTLNFLPVWFALSLLRFRLRLKANQTGRSEERFSRNAETDLVCRLLLEKKKNKSPVEAKTCSPTENKLANNEQSIGRPSTAYA